MRETVQNDPGILEAGDKILIKDGGEGIEAIIVTVYSQKACVYRMLGTESIGILHTERDEFVKIHKKRFHLKLVD